MTPRLRTPEEQKENILMRIQESLELTEIADEFEMSDTWHTKLCDVVLSIVESELEIVSESNDKEIERLNKYVESDVKLDIKIHKFKEENTKLQERINELEEGLSIPKTPEDINPGDKVKFAGSYYKVAEVSRFPGDVTMIGIYDEPPSNHVDFIKFSSIEGYKKLTP